MDHKSGWSSEPGDLYQHVACLEHDEAHWYLRHIAEYGQLGVTGAVRYLLEEHGTGTGPAEATPGIPWALAASGYWEQVGDYLIFWHAGHAYVCLERVIPAGMTAVSEQKQVLELKPGDLTGYPGEPCTCPEPTAPFRVEGLDTWDNGITIAVTWSHQPCGKTLPPIQCRTDYLVTFYGDDSGVAP
jgi:hypothetical protein